MPGTARLSVPPVAYEPRADEGRENPRQKLTGPREPQGVGRAGLRTPPFKHTERAGVAPSKPRADGMPACRLGPGYRYRSERRHRLAGKIGEAPHTREASKDSTHETAAGWAQPLVHRPPRPCSPASTGRPDRGSGTTSRRAQSTTSQSRPGGQDHRRDKASPHPEGKEPSRAPPLARVVPPVTLVCSLDVPGRGPGGGLRGGLRGLTRLT